MPPMPTSPESRARERSRSPWTRARLGPTLPAMTAYRHITVSPIAGALGAEIGGVDIGAGVDDATIAEIRRALLENLVIFFRDQRLDDQSHKAFARRFGKIFIHPNFDTGEGDPEIVAWCAQARRRAHHRRGVALRHHDDARAADGRHPLRPRSAALWRRHAVRQPVSRLRDAVGRHEGDAGRPQGGAQRHQGGGSAGRAERAALQPRARGLQLAADRKRAPRRAHPSRDRPQMPVREPLLHLPLRRHDRSREQAACSTS